MTGGRTDPPDGHDAVVIGAGPAGLAVARQLQHRHGVRALVVDEATEPAMSWRTRYDGFRLNTTGFLSHLPGQRIPLAAGRWPTKDDMVRYFDRYVRTQNLDLELGCHVTGVDRAGDRWELRMSSKTIPARAVVLATGNYRKPVVPAWPGLAGYAGELVHSAAFTNAWPYRGRDVLVVGSGNSAADIAVQLAADGAGRIWLAVRTPPHLVRRAIGPIPSDVFLELFSRVPASYTDPVIDRLNRLIIGDLSAYGFHRPPLGLKATVESRGRIPTLADELIGATRSGRVEVVAAVASVDHRRVILSDGSSVAPEAIIAATGFGTDLDGLVGHLDVLDDRGAPRGGFSSHIGDGLFAIGYGVPPNAPLRAIRLHATPLAQNVALYLTSRARSEVHGGATALGPRPSSTA